MVERVSYRAHGEPEKVFAKTSAIRASKYDGDEEVEEPMSSMKLNTSGVMGQKKFCLNDFKRMAAFTARDLRGWLIYLGVNVYDDGSMGAYRYVGVSVSKDGSAKHVGGDHEKTLQYAELGYRTTELTNAGFAFHAAAQTSLRLIFGPYIAGTSQNPTKHGKNLRRRSPYAKQ